MIRFALLDELAIIAAMALLLAVALARFQLPPFVGALLAVALVGSFGGRLVRSAHTIDVLAEIAVVLLLLAIGLKVAITHLQRFIRQTALGGPLQAGSAILVACLVFSEMGFLLAAAPPESCVVHAEVARPLLALGIASMLFTPLLTRFRLLINPDG